MSWGGVFDVPGKEARIGALSDATLKPGFWDAVETAQNTMQELARLEETVGPWQQLRRRLDDAAGLLELAAEEPEPDGFAGEIREELNRMRADYERLEMQDIL